MIKICMITTDHSPFDERIFYKEAMSLKNAGYEVSIVGCTSSNIYTRFYGIEVIGLKKGKGLISNPIHWLAIAKHASKVDASIYHCHEPESFLVALYLRIIKGKKIVYDVHEYYDDTMEHVRLPLKIFLILMLCIIDPIFCKYTSAIITADEGIAERYSRFSDNVVPIFNFPSSKVFNCSNYEGIKERYRDRFLIVYVGGLTQDRGILEAIKAVHKAAMKHPNIRLLLIGRFMSKEFEEICTTYIRHNDLQGNVELLGFIPHEQVPKYIKASDVGIALFHPTKRLMKTSFPIKIFEYMICGKSVIASDFPALRKVLEGSGCGIFVNPMAINEVSEAIIYAIEHPDAIEIMGKNGKKAIQKRYNWEEMEKILQEIYNRIVN